MKNKKVAIIAIIVIILLSGGVFGYLYFGTDTFKNNKDRFYKYIAQNKEISEILEDELITKYEEKKKSSPYENNGNIKISTNTGNSDVDKVFDDIEISYEGKADIKNKKLQEDLKATYQSQNVSLRIVEDGDKYALKSELLGNEYYGFENNNLKEFAKKLGISDTSNIPDKIDLEELKKQFFTEDELKEIYKRYKDELVNSFEDKDFTKVTENGQDGYKLTITDAKLYDVSVKLLEKLKDDNTILDKVVKLGNNQYTAEDIKAGIDSAIQEIKNQEPENKEILYITVYTEKGKLVKTVIDVPETDGVTIKITITKTDKNAQIIMVATEDGSEFTAEFNINKEKEGSNLKNTIEFKVKANGVSAGFNVDIDYTNIKELSDVTEKVTIGFEGTSNSSTISGNVAITNESKFVNSVDTDSLNDAKLLNDCSEEELQELFGNIEEPLQSFVSGYMGKSYSNNLLPDYKLYDDDDEITTDLDDEDNESDDDDEITTDLDDEDIENDEDTIDSEDLDE